MARRFLYAIAVLVVVVLLALAGLRFWSRELTHFAFVPHVAFHAPPPLPGDAYADPAMWISRPGMDAATDPARWLPRGAASEAVAKETGGEAPVAAAVFFVHPTSFLARDRWNAPLDDMESRTRGELFVRGLASAFNAAPQLWAPRYRQATLGAFLTDAPAGKAAIDAAYADVLAAFDHFVAATDPAVPIVLAGHSQGGVHILRLLADRVAGRPLARRIAAAYVVGWPVSLAHDLPRLGLPACATPDQAGCVLSWQSYAEPADTAQVMETYARFRGLDGANRAVSAFLCTNPLTGTISGTARASANLGTLIPDMSLSGASLARGMVAARCDAQGILLIGQGPALGPYVLPGNNYHVYDIPLFWANLRRDFARRVAAWQRAKPA